MVKIAMLNHVAIVLRSGMLMLGARFRQLHLVLKRFALSGIGLFFCTCSFAINEVDLLINGKSVDVRVKYEKDIIKFEAGDDWQKIYKGSGGVESGHEFLEFLKNVFSGVTGQQLSGIPTLNTLLNKDCVKMFSDIAELLQYCNTYFDESDVEDEVRRLYLPHVLSVGCIDYYGSGADETGFSTVYSGKYLFERRRLIVTGNILHIHEGVEAAQKYTAIGQVDYIFGVSRREVLLKAINIFPAHGYLSTKPVFHTVNDDFNLSQPAQNLSGLLCVAGGAGLLGGLCMAGLSYYMSNAAAIISAVWFGFANGFGSAYAIARLVDNRSRAKRRNQEMVKAANNDLRREVVKFLDTLGHGRAAGSWARFRDSLSRSLEVIDISSRTDSVGVIQQGNAGIVDDENDAPENPLPTIVESKGILRRKN